MEEAISSTIRKIDDHRHEPHEGAVTYTIKVLSSLPADDGKEVRTVLFSRTSPGESIEISAETDAPNLLARLPDFLDAAMELQRSLWPAQRTISRLSSSFFPSLAEESRRVRWLAEGAPEHERAELERRRVAREALIVRDVAWEAIRGVLPRERRREIDALVGVSETPADLAASMDAIAVLIDAMLGDPEDREVLAACDIDGAYAAALRRHAAVLRAAEAGATPPEPHRPRVLRLIGMAYRALRSEAFLALTRPESPPRVVPR
jgi:hypothetical protein